jgi:hypothetical protein
MKNRRVIFLVLGLVLAFALALLLRGLVQDILIVPFTKIIWYIKGYYGAFPQSVYWIIVLAVAGLIALSSMLLPDWDFWNLKEKKSYQGGNVHLLAFWIGRLRRGAYPRWYVARELARLASDIIQRQGDPEDKWQLQGPGWNPPQEIQKYLETAFKNNYAEFLRQGSSVSRTSGEADIKLAIEYLESLMESDDDNQHS